MFPPRAESVDSISAQPAVDHRPEERPSGDSPRPAEGTSNVIVFPRAAERRVSYAPTEPAGPRVTGRQRAGFKRNPLRRLYSRTGMAVTIAGKLHRGEPLRAEGWIDELKWLRQGAEAARLLAEELDGFVGRMEGLPKPANVRVLSPVEFAMAYEQSPPELKRLVCAEIERVLTTRNEGPQQ